MKKNSKSNFVIDTSVYISYARNGKIYRMYNAIEKYELNIFVNDKLLEEFERNMSAANLFTKVELAEMLIALKGSRLNTNTV